MSQDSPPVESDAKSADRNDSPPLDPVFVNTRREAGIILVTWVVFLIWVIGYCSQNAYKPIEGELSITMGIPTWLFWGVFLPWLIAAAFTIWFGLFYMADDPLDDEDQAENAEVNHG